METLSFSIKRLLILFCAILCTIPFYAVKPLLIMSAH